MLPLFVLAAGIWITYLLGSAQDRVEQLHATYVSKIHQRQMVSLSEAIALYTRLYGTYPVSMSALAATPGFSYTASLVNGWQGYGLSPVITDTNWQFRRAVLFTNDPTKGVSVSAYLATNNISRPGGPMCGVGGFNTAVTWCGSDTSMWYRAESRDEFNDRINNERARVNRLSRKFASYYNGNGNYPILDGSNTPLTVNSVTSLASLVGYAGGAGNCSGQFVYQGIPIDCGDMFNSWGLPIGYQFISGAHIILVSETPIINAAGVPLIIAVDRA
jgi:hypothetical protein